MKPFQEETMNSDIDKLNEIDGAVFHSIEHNFDNNTLKIEVVTRLLIDEIDSKIMGVLADRYVLVLTEGEMENKLPLSMERGNLAPIPLEDRFWLTYGVTLKPKTDHQIISGKIMKSWGTEIFVKELTTDVDKLSVAFVTSLFLDMVDFLFREALEDFDLIKEESYLTLRGDGYSDGAIQYEFNKVLQSNYREIYEDIDRMHAEKAAKKEVDKILVKTNNGCPDCKDGFYYPLIGSPEPCRICKCILS